MSVTMRFGEIGQLVHFGPLQTRIRTAVRRCIADEIERLLGVLTDAVSGSAT